MCDIDIFRVYVDLFVREKEEEGEGERGRRKRQEEEERGISVTHAIWVIIKS